MELLYFRSRQSLSGDCGMNLFDVSFFNVI